jgi:hypothetical protein
VAAHRDDIGGPTIGIVCHRTFAEEIKRPCADVLLPDLDLTGWPTGEPGHICLTAERRVPVSAQDVAVSP